jgi:hypothetical protein
MMQSLPPFGNSTFKLNENLSRLISYSLIDQYGNDIFINEQVEFVIPRDINMIIPQMNFQNVTSLNQINRPFNFHFVNIPRYNNLSLSISFEMHPMNNNLSYLFIYSFQLNQIDGWTLFCPSSESFFFYRNNLHFIK